MKHALFSLAFMVASVTTAVAQSYPQKIVRIIVPSAPGGAMDSTARIVAEKLREKLGQPVIIENKTGAANRIGAEYVAKAPADGYTLLVAHDGTMAMNKVIYNNLSYDPQKDFEPVALLTSIPEVIMVNSAFQAKTLAELVSYAKANPGKLNHATGGTATLLALELFRKMAGVNINSVSYRGAGPAVNGLMAGDVELCIADIASASAGLQSPRVRPLAMAALKSVKQYPDVPTADKSGVPGFEVSTWMDAFAPAGTPKEIIKTLEDAIQYALKSDDARTKLEAIGMTIRSGTAAEMRDELAQSIDKWARLVKEQNITIAQ